MLSYQMNKWFFLSLLFRLQWEALHDAELTVSAAQPQEKTWLLHHPQSTHGGIRGKNCAVWFSLVLTSVLTLQSDCKSIVWISSRLDLVLQHIAASHKGTKQICSWTNINKVGNRPMELQDSWAKFLTCQKSWLSRLLIIGVINQTFLTSNCMWNDNRSGRNVAQF